ncbi:hypothetical protein GCM10010299_74230 [Streptomyces tanashiensis]|nr:hypothetical protein GCM10010299_74230 [Streptomyces tanashiensis]
MRGTPPAWSFGRKAWVRSETPSVFPAGRAAAPPAASSEIQRGSRGNAGILHLPDGPAQRRRDARMAVHAALRDRAMLYAHETGRSVVPSPA